jgi:hypothetical protein
MKAKSRPFRMIAWVKSLKGTELVQVKDIGRYETLSDVENAALSILEAGNSEVIELWDARQKVKTLYRCQLH